MATDPATAFLPRFVPPPPTAMLMTLAMSLALSESRPVVTRASSTRAMTLRVSTARESDPAMALVS